MFRVPTCYLDLLFRKIHALVFMISKEQEVKVCNSCNLKKLKHILSGEVGFLRYHYVIYLALNIGAYESWWLKLMVIECTELMYLTPTEPLSGSPRDHVSCQLHQLVIFLWGSCLAQFFSSQCAWPSPMYCPQWSGDIPIRGGHFII